MVKYDTAHRDRTPTYYLGVDPGKNGGIALIDGNADVIDIIMIPDKAGAIYNWLSFHLLKNVNLVASIEKVHSMPSQASQSTFTFGIELGKCEAVLDIIRCRREELELGSTTLLTPRPQDWIKSLAVPHKVNDFATKLIWKRYLRSVAKDIFPKAKLWSDPWWNQGRTDAVSDALLIAYHGWLTEN